jgi:elongation factor G
MSVALGAVHPLLPALPPAGVGCAEVARLLAHGFPSPPLRTAPGIVHADGSPHSPLEADPAGPLVGEVIARLDAPLTLVRLYSGTLTDGARVEAGDATVTASLPQHAPTAVAGELVAVAGLDQVPVATTLTAPGASLRLERWDLPATSIAATVTGFERTDPDHAAALALLLADDPSLRAEEVGDAGLTVWCVGVRHAEEAVARLSSLLATTAGAAQPIGVTQRWTRPPGEPTSGSGRHTLVQLELTLPDSLVGAVLRHLPTCLGTRLSSSPGNAGEDAVVTVELPMSYADIYVAEVRELTDGTAAVEILPPR